MNRILSFGLFVLLAAGCRQPADVELTQDGATAELEVLPVVIPDTNIVPASVDSSAILPVDLIRYSGTLLIHHITLDAGPQKASFAYAAAFVVDTLEHHQGRLVGFSGEDLGLLTLNGLPLLRVPHRISVKQALVRDTVITRGVEYIADLTGSYMHGSPYVWRALGTYAAFSKTIQSPDLLTVDAPRGGAVALRTHDLQLRWRGLSGKLTIILSAYDPASRKAKPLLEFRSRTNPGRAIIPSKLLRQLPAHHRHYVLTFVLANRDDVLLPRRGGTRLILVQAASVYSTYIELR